MYRSPTTQNLSARASQRGQIKALLALTISAGLSACLDASDPPTPAPDVTVESPRLQDQRSSEDMTLRDEGAEMPDMSLLDQDTPLLDLALRSDLDTSPLDAEPPVDLSAPPPLDLDLLEVDAETTLQPGDLERTWTAIHAHIIVPHCERCHNSCETHCLLLPVVEPVIFPDWISLSLTLCCHLL